jgi:outer membrane protein assembly factor BamD (BamD/ComL family)
MREYYLLAALIAFTALTGCSSMTNLSESAAPTAEGRAAFEHVNLLVSEGQYDTAYNETQKIIKERSGAPDVALFNLGLISAHSANPKKNYPRALSHFHTVIKEYPQSPLAEPARTWIQVLEEYQRISEEKRLLVRERESLMQEKEKLKYANEKARQVDVEVEKRRRELLRK